MAIKTLKIGDLTWVNMDSVDEASLKYLKDKHNFHQLDIEDLQSDGQTPKIDVYKKYLFVILQFPRWDSKTKTVSPYEIDFFVGDNFLITIQHHSVSDIHDLFKRWHKSRQVKKDWMNKNSGYLLYNIVESLFQKSRPILNKLGREIYDIEKEVFAGQQLDNNLIMELGRHRRNVLGFRRIIDPQRYLMSNLSHIRKPFLSEDTSLYFDDVNDYLSKLWSIIDTYRDTVQGLHVTVESLINQRTNKVISMLTVISVSLLPLTVLSGIYGMNIALPFSHQPLVVWGIFIILTCSILLLISIMRKKRWI